MGDNSYHNLQIITNKLVFLYWCIGFFAHNISDKFYEFKGFRPFGSLSAFYRTKGIPSESMPRKSKNIVWWWSSNYWQNYYFRRDIIMFLIMMLQLTRNLKMTIWRWVATNSAETEVFLTSTDLSKTVKLERQSVSQQSSILKYVFLKFWKTSE